MSKYRSFFKTFLLVLISLSFVVACQSQPTPQNSPTNSSNPPQSHFKVAMILSGFHQDGSWSQGGYEGLQKIQSEYKAQIDYKEYITDEKATDVLREYAKENYD